ncbi:MAG: TOBE domain-containing protein, partial [Symbiobacteriaceae bacterium]
TRFVATFIGKSNLLEGRLVAVDGDTGVVELPGTGRIQVDLTRRNPQVPTSPGSKVVLTVRPEGLQVVEEPEGPNIIPGRVVAAEFTGAYTEYVVAAGQSTFVASVADRYGDLRRPGEPIHLRVPPERVYLVE